MKIHRVKVLFDNKEIDELLEVVNARKVVSECVRKLDVEDYELRLRFSLNKKAKLNMELVLYKGTVYEGNRNYIEGLNRVIDLSFAYHLFVSEDECFLIEIWHTRYKDYDYYKKIEDVMLSKDINDYNIYNLMYYINFNDKAEFARLLMCFLYKNPHITGFYDKETKDFIEKLNYYGYDENYLQEHMSSVENAKNLLNLKGSATTDDLLDLLIYETLNSLYEKKESNLEDYELSIFYNLYYSFLNDNGYFKKIESGVY